MEVGLNKSWTSCQFTDIGKVRKVNEDSLIACDNQRLWAVADGMGGHENGDYASTYVTNSLADFESSALSGVAIARINRILEHCNSHLVEKSDVEQRDIIGCTVALLYIDGPHAHCLWSGDSRIYRLRGTQLKLLTRDHNYESLLADRDIIAHPKAMPGDNQMLTRAVGGDRELQLEHCIYTLDEEDHFLICTDGLFKELADHEIHQMLYQADRAQNTLAPLAQTYQDRGARDNIGMIHIFAELP